MKKIHALSRWLLVAGSLAIICSFFVPIWEIKLWAPQYPEGLSIEIWHNDVKGDVEIINGLNHYIGMKHIKKEMFPEFSFLKYIIIGFIFWGLFIAYMGKLNWLKIYCTSILLGGIVALADFYRWGYDYGHNLDPTAPIQVPGMAYQPPVLGYKVLLNFTALSTPSTGGWVIVGLGVMAFVILFLELFKARKVSPALLLVASSSLMLFSFACSNKQPVINYGKEDCDYCKMKIMDNRFGFAFVTEKGRNYKFDDMNCLKGFIHEEAPVIAQTYTALFDRPGMLVKTESAFYIQSNELKSPMGSGVAAFSSQDVCKVNENKFHAFCATYAQLISK